MMLFFPTATIELANFIARNPKAFDMDGVNMDKTREELIEIFGEPKYDEEGDGPYEGIYMIGFQIGNYNFGFDLPNRNGRVTSFEISDTTNEHAGFGV
jgi:hypothetical protein